MLSSQSNADLSNQAEAFLAEEEVERAKHSLYGDDNTYRDDSPKSVKKSSATSDKSIAQPLPKPAVASTPTLSQALNHNKTSSSEAIVINISNSEKKDEPVNTSSDNGKGIGEEFSKKRKLPKSKEQPESKIEGNNSDFKIPLLQGDNTENSDDAMAGFDLSPKDELREFKTTKREKNSIIKEPSKPRSCEKYKKMIFEPSFVDKYMIPTGAIGLLLHDAFHYSLNSNKRYGTSFYEVFFGIAFKNPNYMLSNFFGTKEGDVRFWAPFSLMMFSTIVSHFIPKPQKLTAAFAKPLGGLYGRLPEPIKNAMRKIAFAGFLFGWGHYLKMISQKVAQLAIHDSNYLDCVNNGKTYTYLSHALKYACALCGFDFVYPPYSNSNQRCLDAVIRQNLPSTQTIDYLNNIRIEGNVSSITIPQAWLNLTDYEINQLLNALTRHAGDRLDRLIIEPPQNRQKPSDSSLQAQADFIRRVKPRELIISGQYYGDSTVRLISKIGGNIPIESLIYENNGLTDSLADTFFASLPFSLRNLSVANNQLTTDSLPKLEMFGRKSFLNSINVSKNSMEFTNSFLNLNGTVIVDINISGNVIRDEAGPIISQTLVQYPIQSLNIADCGVTNNCFMAIADGFVSQNLNSLDISHNLVDNESFLIIDQLPPNLKKCYLNGIDPGVDGFYQVFKLLNSTLTNELHLSGCPLSLTDLEDCHTLKRIEILDISNSDIDNDGIERFCDAYPKDSRLSQLDASGNDLSQESNNLMLETFKNISKLLLNNLNSSPLHAYAALTGANQITALEAARTQVDNLSEDEIACITRGSLESLTLNGTKLDDSQLN